MNTHNLVIRYEVTSVFGSRRMPCRKFLKYHDALTYFRGVPGYGGTATLWSVNPHHKRRKISRISA